MLAQPVRGTGNQHEIPKWTVANGYWYPMGGEDILPPPLAVWMALT